MADIAAIFLSIILGFLAIFQVALVAGAPLGRFAWGGQHTVLPTKLRIGSAVAICLYALISCMALSHANVVALLPETVTNPGMVFATVYTFAGIPLNAISRSKPERLLMTPVVTVLFVLCLLIVKYS